MENNHVLSSLTQLIEASVSPCHCVQKAREILTDAGFSPLSLTDEWEISPGKGYVLPFFDSGLAAFTVGEDLTGQPALRIGIAHTDWPCLRVKPSAEITAERYCRLNVGIYGSPLLSTWTDRPLSVAGKVCLKGPGPFEPVVRFINFSDPILVIPNLAVHLNPDGNGKGSLNPQTDLLPLLGLITDSLDREHFFLKLLAEKMCCAPEDILDFDLFVYNAEPCAVVGMNGEFLSSPRLDNLTSVHACLSGITSGIRNGGINLIFLYDNEEVGGRTRQGASSAVTERILEKLFLSLGYGREALLDAVMGGFLLSLDVAHALHPNRPDKADINNPICLGDGVVLKLSPHQAYSTDSRCVSVMEQICRNAAVPYRKYSQRSDIRGGSAQGSILSPLLAINTVDLGVPVLAMHSARELMAHADQVSLETAVSCFFTRP